MGKAIGDVFKFLLAGVLFVIFFTVSCTERTITSLGESSVARSAVNVSDANFNVKDYGSMVDVWATPTVSSPHALKDFTATVYLYDCPDADTPVGQCKPLGNEYQKFDGDIKAGVSQLMDWKFSFYNVPDHSGVLVPKLELTELRG